MSWLEHRNQRTYRTICEVLREIKNVSKDKKVEELVGEATYYAKRMAFKLKDYKLKYGVDAEKEIFVNPTKEKFMKRTWFGVFINYWDIGLTKVLGRFSGGITLILSLLTLLTVSGFDVSYLMIIVFIVLFIAGVLFGGYLYRRFGFYDKEVNRAMQINPYYKESLSILYDLQEKINR